MNVNEIVSKAFVCREIITIDPGRSNGAICKYTDRFETWNLNKFKFEDMVDFFKYHSEICKMPLVFIEKITTFNPDASNIGRMHRMNKLKDHYTELISAIKLSGMNYIEVMPASWQKYLNIHIKGEEREERKKRYKEIAIDYFPGVKVTMMNCDALLLVEFARTKLKYDQRWILKYMKKSVNKEKLF